MRGKFFKGVSGLLIVMLLASGCGKDGKETTTGKEQESGKTQQTEQKDDGKKTEEKSYVNKTGRRICDETITITMTGRQGATKDWQSSDQIKQIEEQFGIHIDCSPIANDAWDTQKTLMFSSDTLTDLVVNSTLKIVDANTYGEQGYLLPINKYLDYMPNLKATMEKYPDYAKAITAADGNIYGLPTIANYEPAGPGMLNRFYINKVWLKNVGMECPQTIDEFYNVLKAFKEQDANGNGDPNDEIPLLFNENTYWYAQLTLLGAFGIHSNTLNYNLTIDDSGKLAIGNLTDNYKEYLTFMNKLYKEGLIDQECFTLTPEEVNSRAHQERYGVIGTVSSPSITCGQESIKDFDWELIPIITKNAGDPKITARKGSQISANCAQVISSKTKYPEAICRLLDFFYTDEGTLASTQGFEGTGIVFKKLPFANGAEVAQLNYDKTDTSKYKNSGDFRQQYAVIQSAFMTLIDSWKKAEGLVRTCDDATYKDLRSQDIKVLTENGFTGWLVLGEDYIRNEKFEFAKDIPPLLYTTDEAHEVSTLLTDVETYFQTSKAQFITGEMDINKDWDNFVNTAKSMGAERLLKIQQSSYDRVYK